MFRLRQATAADAETIAHGFLTAMWMDDEQQRTMLPLCRTLATRTDTLYSWQHAIIAEQCDSAGNYLPAGVLIAYDGACYKERARTTFTIVRDGGGDDFTQMNAETEPGEWYIDTLAVFPPYRRQGLATQLLRHAIADGLSHDNISAVTLYVDPTHPWVVNLYRSVGFSYNRDNIIFGQTYAKYSIPR